MNFRSEKVASTIKKILAQPVTDVSREISAGFATLTSVRITKDLQLAKVYISLYGKNSQPGFLIDELDRRKHEFRHLLGKELRLRVVPDIRFYIDDTLDKIEQIQSLLDNVKSSDYHKTDMNPE